MLYTVKYGDSLSSIAEAHGISPASLSTMNQLDPHIRPMVGQALIIPDTHDRPRRPITIHGCAMPGSGEATLMGASPYLSCFSVVGCRIQADGSITGLNDIPLLQRAAGCGVVPLLGLSAREDTERPGTLHALLNDASAQEALIAQLLQRISGRNYRGANICLGSVSPHDAEACCALIRRIGHIFREEGLLLMVTLYGAEQSLFVLHEWAGGIILRPEDGAPPSAAPVPPRSIAAISSILECAAKAIPVEKLLLSISSHGYSWQLPCCGALPRTVYPCQAPSLAFSHFADIRYDHTVQASHFSYYDSSGTERMVWFHDPRSICARLELVEKYQLGGVSFCNMAPLYRPGWILLSDMFEPEKSC